jgi:hypothetical protein
VPLKNNNSKSDSGQNMDIEIVVVGFLFLLLQKISFERFFTEIFSPPFHIIDCNFSNFFNQFLFSTGFNKLQMSPDHSAAAAAAAAAA